MPQGQGFPAVISLGIPQPSTSPGARPARDKQPDQKKQNGPRPTCLYSERRFDRDRPPIWEVRGALLCLSLYSQSSHSANESRCFSW